MARNSKSRSGRTSGSSGRRNQRPPTKRQYPRTARLNTLLHEIVADTLDRIDDEQLGFLTVTGVDVDSDLNKAQVYVSSFGTDPTDPTAEASDDELLEVLATHRKAVQAAIGRQARLRKTPEVVFSFDPAVRTGARIEEVIRSFRSDEDLDPELASPNDEPSPEGPVVG